MKLEEPQPSVFCADIAVNKLTGEREKLWKDPHGSAWRHAHCRARGGAFRVGIHDDRKIPCSCPCHK